MPSGHLFRRRLIHSLLAALQRGHLLLEAPAGYGKTILMQQLAAQQPDTYYLNLEPADLDLPILRARLEPLLEAKNTILLDDVHVLDDNSDSSQWLTVRLQEANPRLVLAGRRIPLQTGLLFIQGRLARFTAERLAFSPEESRLMLGGAHVGQKAAGYHEQLEGWPLAVDLLARLPAPAEPLQAAKSQLFSYLARRVFEGLPPPIRRFLYVTAVPLKFNEELAGVLLDGDEIGPLLQEVRRRNLFLYAEEAPGWFRYHDLIREFLLETAGLDPMPYFERSVSWFHEQGDRDSAIEHALAGGLTRRAAQLSAALPYLEIYQSGRYLTYRRWVNALPEAELAQFPVLLARLGAYLNTSAAHRPEAREALRRALQLARNLNDKEQEFEAARHLASALITAGDYAQAVEILHALAEDDACQGFTRLSVTGNLAVSEAYLGRFRDAQKRFREALRLAAEQDNERGALISRQNLATLVLIPLGRLAEAAEALAQSPPQSQAYARLVVLTQRADLECARADWPALTHTIETARTTHEAMETQDAFTGSLIDYYQALLELRSGRLEAAEARLEAAMRSEEVQRHPIAHTLLATARTRLLRRQGRLAEAVHFAADYLSRPIQLPFYRARLSFERDAAVLERWLAGAEASFALADETRLLLTLRARADLLRLRMLLAVACWRRGQRRWRRHAHAARFAARMPGYERLLTERDPDLAARFWQILLIEGVAPAEATAALIQLGQAAALVPLLEHREAPVRIRAAGILAQIGDERVMPDLAAALEKERSAGVCAHFQAALERMESLPPPPLTIRLMGEFTLMRDQEAIPVASFPRPIVLRLLQYFALHRRQDLPRDRILDDLWPDAHPDKAWMTFRSVYSRLRKVLEPYMRRRGSCRYVAVEGETYRFDPLDVVQVDIEQRQQVVLSTLAEAAGRDVPPLPQALFDTLEGWPPLLPDLPYAEWLLATQQRLEDTYLKGTLYLAESLLQHGRHAEAVTWAQRLVTTAPWLEEGYQTLMRAHARQGQRGMALKVYQVAETALARELAVAPSPLTRWLRERLEGGEEI